MLHICCEINKNSGMQMKLVCWVLRTALNILIKYNSNKKGKIKTYQDNWQLLGNHMLSHQLRQKPPSGCKLHNMVITLQGKTNEAGLDQIHVNMVQSCERICRGVWVCDGGRSLYLVFWGVAYLKRKWDIWEGCRSLVTPGGDSRSSPHLKHTESAHTDDAG